MTDPFVTIGVPVYQGQDHLLAMLECLRIQTFPNLDVLISVDAGDQDSARACEPFLRRDPFRMHIQPSRLGWAANTDWTMRNRRGEFYIYQQQDDLVSPTYVGDLVGAALRHPEAAICYAQVQWTGLQSYVQRGLPLSGPPIKRVLTYLKFMDGAPFRGLIRSSVLNSTSGLLVSDFDRLESFGTDIRFMAELALLGEFRFVPGPTYYKSLHGANVSLKQGKWPEHRKRLAWACLAAWMIEVVVPAGRTPQERKGLFDSVLIRFLVSSNPWKWLRDPARRLDWTHSKVLHPIRAMLAWLKSNDSLVKAVAGRWMFYEPRDQEDRTALLHTIFDRLETAGRFQPETCLQMTWEALEEESRRLFVEAR